MLSQMKHCSAAERLYPLLQQGPTIRHHTARALVYLGEIDTKGVSVFHRSNGVCVYVCVCVCVCVYVCVCSMGERCREWKGRGRELKAAMDRVNMCVCVW